MLPTATQAHLLLQAIPQNKRGPFLHISEWEEFKSCLTLEYGSFSEFGGSVQAHFLHLTLFTTKREVSKILAPKIKQMESVIDCVDIYHNIFMVKNIILKTRLKESIIRCLPP